MYLHSRLIAFVLCLFIAACNNVGNPSRNFELVNVNWKKIPDSWINKATHFNYKKPNTALISEFAKILSRDTLFNPLKLDDGSINNGIFNLVSADLDGDGKNELLCLQGKNTYSPILCVFKQVNDKWYLIYEEDIDTFYESPTLYVASNYSKNKTFYLRRVYDHGSDIYIDGYSFYKLINDRVYKSLDIINDAHIDGWGLYMNQKVKSKFEFNGDRKDELTVNYMYNFFPGNIYKSDCPWCSHEDISLIKGDDRVYYNYNDSEHKYKLDVPKYRNSAFDLTAEKISCFADFGNDSLFVKAFKRDIDTTLKIGSPLQKKILRKYLLLADKNKTVTTVQLEEKTRAGGTVFYGPKK